MRKKAPTIYDVAQRAQVSVSTVSRVLNGHERVANDLRERVQAAMEELRFRPNRFARNLYRHRSNLLGCVLPDITNPYFAQLFLELETYAYERGYTVFLGNTASRVELERAYLASLAEQQVDGILLLGGRANTCGVGPEDVADLAELTLRLPIVAVNGDLPGDVVVSSVASDEREGARLACAHLRGLGHSRVAFLGGQADVTSTVEKLSVYEAHFPGAPAAWVQLTGLTVKAGEEALERALDAGPPPTAVLCASDLVAAGVLAAARTRGLRVPEDLSVVGFDDTFLAESLFPRLTSVNHSYAAVARRAVDVLIETIARHTPPRTVRVAPVLVARDSTCAPTGAPIAADD